MRTPLAAAAALMLGASLQAQVGASIGGVLVSREGRLPIEGARIAVLGTTLSASTDSTGRFDLPGVPAGVRVLQARAIGFSVASWLVELGEGQSFRDTFEIEPRVVSLAAVNVRADPSDWRSEAAFERRRANHAGAFVTREEIRGRRPGNLTDLLRGVPGLLTSCGARSCTIRMTHASRPCLPEYFLDGFPATLATGANFPVNVSTLRGVEIYRNQFEVPPEFQKVNLRCGVIALWTISPGERLGESRN